jgi:hypothetical protein
MKLEPNQITGANAGGPYLLAIRTLWAARIAQFCRYSSGGSSFEAGAAKNSLASAASASGTWTRMPLVAEPGSLIGRS